MQKILIADDEIELVAALKIRLQARGFEVTTAIDGEDALNKARALLPDLMILDLMMPKRDGYSVCKMLKSDKRYSHVPIIMLTARVQEKDKQLGSEVGANCYMTKPFEKDELIKKIQEFIKD